jgi:predicted transcriptional regulator
MLTPLELDIMKAVWRIRPITVRDVQEAIRPVRNLAYTTVMTIMDRLYHKGFLSRTLRARTHYYEPVIDYTDVRDEAVDSLIRSFFGSKEKLQEFLEGESIVLPPKMQTEPRLDETLL